METAKKQVKKSFVILLLIFLIGSICGTTEAKSDDSQITPLSDLTVTMMSSRDIGALNVEGLIETDPNDPDWVLVTSQLILMEDLCYLPWYDRVFNPCYYPDRTRYWKLESGANVGKAFPMAGLASGSWTFDGLYVREGFGFQLYYNTEEPNDPCDLMPASPYMCGPQYVSIDCWRDVSPAPDGFEPNTFFVSGGPGALSNYSIIIDKGCGPCDLYLIKVDDVNDGSCVGPGDYITYHLCYSANGYPDSNVIITDFLPNEVDFNDASGNWSRDSNTVTWYIGTLGPNESGCVTLTVKVNTKANPPAGITNCSQMSGDCIHDIMACESTPICFVPPCQRQLASFDDIAAEGWYDERVTGWMKQEVNEVNEGTGSMRIAFSLWNGEIVDIGPKMAFDPPLDFSDYHNLAITLWVWDDCNSNSKFREIILYDDANHDGRFVAHPPDSNGWTKVVANLDAFSWYTNPNNIFPTISPDDVNWSSIKTIELFSSCGTTAGYNHDIYLDDLRLDSNQVALSQATIVNADRTFGTITVDGNAADWAALDDSDVVDFDLATVPDQPHGNLHVKYRLAWDPDYLYILVEEQPGDTLATEANEVGTFAKPWSLADRLGGDAYYDALALYFDFTNAHPILGGREGISLWLYLGLNSKGKTTVMMAWTNALWGYHAPAAIANGSMATSGSVGVPATLGSRITEAKIKWSDLDSAIATPGNEWRLPEGGLAAAIKPGYIFGCNPRLNDFEKSTLWGSPTVERGTAWLNGKLWWDNMWDHQGTPSATGIYAKDVRLVCSAGDLDYDCDVDFVDLQVLVENWLDDGCNNLNNFCNGADIVINGEVDMKDYAKLALRWLE